MKHLNNKFERHCLARVTELNEVVTEFIICRKTNSYGSRYSQQHEIA